MTERPTAGERAVIVQLDFGQADLEDQLEEVRLLTESAGGLVVAEVFGRRHSPDPKTFAGKGKVQEIAAMLAAGEADLVIFNHELSPAQERNLERELKCRVIDRTSLILDIFALRAASAEGKLQVELAQLQYRLPRLTGMGQVLSRLGGGIGTRGPGETKLETDRRAINRKINYLQRRLKEIASKREVLRKERIKNDIYYIDNLSLWMDIKVFFKTVVSVLKREDVFIEQKSENKNGEKANV